LRRFAQLYLDMHMSLVTLAALVAAPTPPTLPLNDGNRLPMVSLGGGYNRNNTVNSVLLAVEAGFRGIDTALTYFSQPEVGEALDKVFETHNRSEIFVTTKVPGCADPDPTTCLESTKQNHQRNLKQLGLPSVDLLLLHWGPITGCSADPASRQCRMVRQQWEGLQELQAEGLATSIGVSNYCEECLECLLSDEATTVVPAVNQFELHVGMGPDPEGLVTYCRSKGIAPMAYSPLGPTFNQTAKDVLVHGALVSEIGQSHNVSGASVSLRWLSQRGVPLVTRSLSPSHLEADLKIFAWNLTSSELGRLDAATEPYHTPCLYCSKGAE